MIIYTRPSGKISVVHPVPRESEIEELGQQAAYEAAIKRSLKRLPDYASDPRVVTGDVLPSDRRYRDAWESSGAGVGINIPRARGIFMARLRRARNGKLKELDTETTIALGRGDDQKRGEVEQKKQRLRDLPQTVGVDDVQTIEALDALWPDDLDQPDGA